MCQQLNILAIKTQVLQIYMSCSTFPSCPNHFQKSGETVSKTPDMLKRFSVLHKNRKHTKQVTEYEKYPAERNTLDRGIIQHFESELFFFLNVGSPSPSHQMGIFRWLSATKIMTIVLCVSVCLGMEEQLQGPRA